MWDRTHTRIERIIRQKRARIAARKQTTQLEQLLLLARQQARPANFLYLLRRGGVVLLAELKPMTPAGLRVEGYDPLTLGIRYQRLGASALLITTDDVLYGGTVEHLADIRSQVQIPILQMDFIVDPYQIYEARAAGADGVNLVVALLSDMELRELLALTQRLRMVALVEIRTERDLEHALPLMPRLIGINNQDIGTGIADLSVTTRLRDKIPQATTVVSLGGVTTSPALRRMAELRVDAVSVDETMLVACGTDDRLKQLVSLNHRG